MNANSCVWSAIIGARFAKGSSGGGPLDSNRVSLIVKRDDTAGEVRICGSEMLVTMTVGLSGSLSLLWIVVSY